MTDTTNNTEIPVIAANALIVVLNMSCWANTKKDSRLTDEVSASKGTKDGVLRVSRNLLSSPTLDAIKQLQTRVRTKLYEVTRAWGDTKGERIIMGTEYPVFAEYFTDQRDEHDQLADRFCYQEYKQAVENERFRQNSLFDINDYPPPSALREKFGMTLRPRPIATAGDFRTTLADPVRDKIREQYRQELGGNTSAVVHELWEELGGMIAEIRDRLSEPKPRFKEALMGNFFSMVERLDKLNMAGDPALDDLRNTVEKELLALRDPEAIRKDDATRVQAVQDTQKVIDKFEGLWG